MHLRLDQNDFIIFEICNEYKNRKSFIFFYSNIEIDKMRNSKENKVIVIA